MLYNFPVRLLIPSLLFLLIATACIFGNSTPYFSVSHVRKGTDFHFPVLNLQRDAKVETEINQLLQLSELRSLVDRRRRDVFTQATIDDGSIYGRKISLFFDIHANNSRILSLGFNNSSCGATCTWWVKYYNFNPRNGDLIALSDLFTADGYKAFTKMVVQKRSREYRAEVERKVSAEDREAFLGVLGTIENDELEEFSIGNGYITIDGQNCLGKSLSFDNVNMKVRSPLREFKGLLNEYGKVVFGLKNGNVSKFRSNQLPQLFNGTVNGGSPFVAVLSTDFAGKIEGIYAYLKYRKGIYLTGTLSERSVAITEHVLVETNMNLRTDSNHKFVDFGSILGTFDGYQLNGIWTDKDNLRSHQISALRD